VLKSKHRAKQKREPFIMTTEQIIKILRQKKEYFKEKYGVKKSPYSALVLVEFASPLRK